MSTESTTAIPQIVQHLRQHYQNNATRPYQYRHQQLSNLLRFLQEQEQAIQEVLKVDLGKPAAESLSAEIAMLAAELKYTLKHLACWMKPKRVSTPMVVMPGKSIIYPEPLGVVLIISPWNYPIQLTLAPLIGALAAGNCVVIKPSEVAAATSQFLAKKLRDYLDPACVVVIEGGVDETTALLDQSFDHILYTGNGKIGRVVMTAAAKHLTPVTLELGGKSPVIVDDQSDIKTTARRIVWGKFSNAGQTCIAPDYLLVHEKIADELLLAMRDTLKEFYGEDPKASQDYGRIINNNHYQRLINLIPGSGEIYLGGTGDASTRYIAPTILTNVTPDSPIMTDEIFGPILPIIKIKNIDEGIAYVNARSKPLALYIFSSNRATQEQIIQQTSSGSVCVNYCMMQVLVPDLPFGGVGPSGMGCYHGKASFATFSHYKSVLKKPFWPDLSVLYPPYGKNFLRLVRWLMM